MKKLLFRKIFTTVADHTAKDYQEFNGMPGISVPCTTSLLGLIAKPFNALLDKIPGVNKLDASPEKIRSTIGIFGELGVMGVVIGVVIGLLGGYQFGAVSTTI